MIYLQKELPSMPTDLFRKLDAIAIPRFVHGGVPVFRCGDLASAVFTVRRGRIAIAWVGPYTRFIHWRHLARTAL